MIINKILFCCGFEFSWFCKKPSELDILKYRNIISTLPGKNIYWNSLRLSHRNFQSWTNMVPIILLKYFLCSLNFRLLITYKQLLLNSEEKYNLPTIFLYRVLFNLAASNVEENRQINMQLFVNVITEWIKRRRNEKTYNSEQEIRKVPVIRRHTWGKCWR